MIEFSKVRAVEMHIRAEELYSYHADGGYDGLQTPKTALWQHPPTIAQTVAHYRAQTTAAVISPVDVKRKAGYEDFDKIGFKDHLYEGITKNNMAPLLGMME